MYYYENYSNMLLIFCMLYETVIFHDPFTLFSCTYYMYAYSQHDSFLSFQCFDSYWLSLPDHDSWEKPVLDSLNPQEISMWEYMKFLLDSGSRTHGHFFRQDWSIKPSLVVGQLQSVPVIFKNECVSNRSYILMKQYLMLL